MKQITILFSLFTLFTCKAYCQRLSAVSYTALTASKPSFLQEKIYVHTDRTFYIAGEIMWFKIYCVEASTHQLVDLSKVAYIELLDSTHKPIAQAKIPLQNGDGNGSFALPVTLASGNYQLRAYTNWMKNEEANHFFEKNITVINTQKLTVGENKEKPEAASISFYPEGGNLVSNIKSRIGFKAIDQQGKGMHCTGTLWDGNDSLLSFSDHQNGIGSFYFTPLKNHVYTANIQTENKRSFTQALPSVEENGFSMNLDRVNMNNISINIEASGIPAQPIYLIIHKNYKTVLAKETTLENDKAGFTVDTALLPSGVSTLTLFNAEKQPVCERLFYKKYPQNFALSLDADDTIYDTRKKVNIRFRTNDAAVTGTDSASLSMSVYRIDSLQNIDNNTIDSYLTFSSELEDYGNYQPGNLYESSKKDAAEMDELMLVNGWRKLNPAKASGTKQPVLSFVPEYRGHLITGNIVNNITHLPEKNMNVYLSLPGKGKQFYSALSDSLGNITWETENWYGDAKLVAQTDRQDSTCTIVINDPFSHFYSTLSTVPFILPYHHPNTLLQHSISMQASTIYIGNEMNNFAISPADSTPFFVTADKSYRLDDYSRFTTLEEVLREYIALVNVTKKKGNYHFPVYDFSGEKMFEDDPLVLVDGIPFFNLDSFIIIDPLKLKKMDVVNRRYFYGNVFFDGILNWQTYTGDANGIDIDPKAVVMDYEGLQEKREFYSPQYETGEQLNSHMPDFRNTLYWNPDIRLKGSEAKQLSFYTSDMPGKYVAVVQGVGSRGLCSATITFDVVKK